MLIEAARRAETAAKEMLACINAGPISSAEARQALEITRAFMAAGAAFQVGAARVVAAAERHGDGGAQVLADTAGTHRGDAHSRIKTAQTIQEAPTVRDAVESGLVSQANAKRLAEAIDKTSAEVVESDGGLLSRAKSMRPEQFSREARRWTADRRRDSGEADYQRRRARRCVRVFDGDDGMVHLRGEFDPVTGTQIANRLRAEAGRLRDADRRQAASGETRRRSFDQCMADALDNLTNSNNSITSCGTSRGVSGTSTGGSADGDTEGGGSAGGGRPFADICVVAHVDNVTGDLIAELPNGERLPTSVLDELACNARLTGVVFDRRGKPIWRTHSGRRVTESQWQLLIAKWGGCFHCGANPGICQAHHIEPVSKGGPTKLDNLVPACWTCHQRIHRDHWQIHKSPNGNHTLHPPDRTCHGPARAPDEPTLFKPRARTEPAAADRAGPRVSEHPPLFQPRTRPEPAPDSAGLAVAAHAPDEPTLFTPESESGPDPDQATAGLDPARAGPAAARAVLRDAKPQPQPAATPA